MGARAELAPELKRSLFTHFWPWDTFPAKGERSHGSGHHFEVACHSAKKKHFFDALPATEQELLGIQIIWDNTNNWNHIARHKCSRWIWSSRDASENGLKENGFFRLVFFLFACTKFAKLHCVLFLAQRSIRSRQPALPLFLLLSRSSLS